MLIGTLSITLSVSVLTRFDCNRFIAIVQFELYFVGNTQRDGLKVYVRFSRARAFVFSALSTDRTNKEDVRNCIHLISSYPLMKGIRPGMIPSSYETGSNETKNKIASVRQQLFDLLCGSSFVLYRICVVLCFVLFFSFMFFLAAVVNLFALKEPSKALITRTRPFENLSETISYPFAQFVIRNLSYYLNVVILSI